MTKTQGKNCVQNAKGIVVLGETHQHDQNDRAGNDSPPNFTGRTSFWILRRPKFRQIIMIWKNKKSSPLTSCNLLDFNVGEQDNQSQHMLARLWWSRLSYCYRPTRRILKATTYNTTRNIIVESVLHGPCQDICTARITIVGFCTLLYGGLLWYHNASTGRFDACAVRQ